VSILMSILSSDSYIILNKYVMKAIGLHEAILLGELCSEYIYWCKEEKLQDGYFFSTRENIERETTLSPHQQRQALKNLVNYGFVEVTEKDMPKKTYYKIIENKVYDFLSNTELEFADVKKFNDKSLKNLTSSDQKIEDKEVKKFNTNNNNINNNKNNILSNHIEDDEIDKIDYEKIFKENIEYEILIQDERQKGLIQNITDIAVETLNSKHKEIYINSEPISIELVRSQYMKLNPMHIQYLINCLQQNTKDVKSIKSYIRTSLYNATKTMNVDTTLQVAKVMNN
jgi:hypothetical protein